jgi:glycosyltransferase involved in cell wall biosynthesis
VLENVTIVIPTFHRRGLLKDCLRSIEENLPECSVVVVSDDGVIPQTANELYLPYDSGLTAKRNAGVRAVCTPYTLIGSDDFDFTGTREHIITMTQFMNVADVIAGRVNNKPYEGSLEYVPGEYIKEHRLDSKGTPWLMDLSWKIDIAANYFLARTEVLRKIPWDESIRPIGGEHVDWFLDLKAANKRVYLLPFANINTFPYDANKQDSCYRDLRRRAWQGHELMMKKRGIKRYYSFDEEIKS